ncbi:hypothetical protein M8J76_014463 [Diaphorina citri]|nr:hypothetical protein M8J76_014463 [Diaphorina citri]
MSFGDMKLFPREKHNHAPTPTSSNSPRSPIPTVPKDTDISVPISQCTLSSISPAPRPCIQTPKQLSDDNQGNRAPPTPATHTPLSAFLSDVAKTIDWDKTPVTTSTIIELKSQVRALAQEIIKKEVIIENLRKKSESDEVLIRDLTASIQSLEDRDRADKETNTDTLSNVDSAVQTETGSSSAVLNTASLPLSAPSSSNVRAKPSRSRRRRKRKSAVKAPLPTQQPQHFSQRDGEHTRRIVIVSDSMGRGLASILTAMLPSADVTGYVYPNAGFNDVIQRAADVSADLSRDDFLLVLAGTNNTSVLSPSTCPLCSLPYGIPADLSSDPCFITTNTMRLLHERTNLILSAIPYRFDNFRHQNNNIFHLNKYLQQKCVSLGVKFMSVELRRHHYTSHGLHLRQNGKQALAVRFKQYSGYSKLHSRIPATATAVNHSDPDVLQLTLPTSAPDLWGDDLALAAPAAAAAPPATTTTLVPVNTSNLDFESQAVQDLVDVTCPDDLVDISFNNSSFYSSDSSLFFLDSLPSKV